MTADGVTPWPDDETLLAFVDGHLDAETMMRVAKVVESDAELTRLVEKMRASGALAAVAFEDALNAPVRDTLIDMILTAPAIGVQNDKSNILPFGSPAPVSFQTRYEFAALAASLILVVGGLAGYQMGTRAQSATTQFDQIAVGPVTRGSVISDVLTKRRSGDPIALTQSSSSSKIEAMVLASIRDRDGRMCRELETTHVQPSGAHVVNSVACLDDVGGWTIVGSVQGASGSAPSDQTFSPATGNDQPALDGILKAIGATPALSPEDEAGLIERNWK